MKKLVALLSLAVIGGWAGCAERPTQAEAEAGCSNLVKLTFWEGVEGAFTKRNLQGEVLATARVGAQEEYDKALKPGGELKKNLDQCVELVTTRGSKEQAACLATAKTAADAKACTNMR